MAPGVIHAASRHARSSRTFAALQFAIDAPVESAQFPNPKGTHDEVGEGAEAPTFAAAANASSAAAVVATSAEESHGPSHLIGNEAPANGQPPAPFRESAAALVAKNEVASALNAGEARLAKMAKWRTKTPLKMRWSLLQLPPAQGSVKIPSTERLAMAALPILSATVSNVAFDVAIESRPRALNTTP